MSGYFNLLVNNCQGWGYLMSWSSELELESGIVDFLFRGQKGSDPSVYVLLYMFALHSSPRQIRRGLSNHLSSFHSQLKPSIVQTFSSPSFPSQFFQSMFIDPPSLYFLHPPPPHRTRIFNPFPKWCSGLIAIIAITYLHPTLALACADQA